MDASAVGAATSAYSTTSTAKSYEDLTPEDFLQILIAELTSQDPFEPMDNGELLNQLSDISSLQSNVNLSDNLSNLIAQQRLSTASTLIGRFVTAMDSEGQVASGVVESVRVVDGVPYLVLGEWSVPVESVVEVSEVEVEEATDGSSA